MKKKAGIFQFFWHWIIKTCIYLNVYTNWSGRLYRFYLGLSTWLQRQGDCLFQPTANPSRLPSILLWRLHQIPLALPRIWNRYPGAWRHYQSNSLKKYSTPSKIEAFLLNKFRFYHMLYYWRKFPSILNERASFKLYLILLNYNSGMTITFELETIECIRP